jgi:hypothetical protein
MRCRLITIAACVAVLFSSAPAHAALIQENMSEHLSGGAGNNSFGGYSYDQVSPTFKSNLGFDLSWPGYQSGLPTYSSGGATWTDTPTSITYSDSASQTCSPTPSFTQYPSAAAMASGFTDNFQVSETSGMTLTSTLDGDFVHGGTSSSGTVRDNNVVVYSWSGSAALTTPVVLTAGDEINLTYNSLYGTFDFTSVPLFTDGFSSSFQMNVSPVPEPTSLLALGVGTAVLLHRRRRR